MYSWSWLFFILMLGLPAVAVFRRYASADPTTRLQLRWLGFGTLAVIPVAVIYEIWRSTLRNIAKHFGVDTPVETRIVVVDRRWQWKYARNIWQNAGIRSTLTAPIRWLRPRGRTTV